jgi:hypothetical protein
MTTRKRPPAHQRPLIATVTALPLPDPKATAIDLMHTLRAVGLNASREQADVLASAGMTGLGCWIHSNDLNKLDAAVQQTRRLELAMEVRNSTRTDPTGRKETTQ